MQQVFERGGTLEIAVARPGSQAHDPAEHVTASDLVFRLKILELADDHISIEGAVALGKAIKIQDGTELVGAITIGQNRWKFRSRVLSSQPAGRGEALRLELPESVERCLRRFTRFEVAGLQLPTIDVYPLLDPTSTTKAEEFNESVFAATNAGAATPCGDQPMPKVGPKFNATLMNIGGGGIGIRVEAAEAGALSRHRIFWFSIPMGGRDAVPVVASGKVVHTHLDSSQCTYAGVSFDFSFRPTHQTTVADQVALHMTRAQQQ